MVPAPPHRGLSEEEARLVESFAAVPLNFEKIERDRQWTVPNADPNDRRIMEYSDLVNSACAWLRANHGAGNRFLRQATSKEEEKLLVDRHVRGLAGEFRDLGSAARDLPSEARLLRLKCRCFLVGGITRGTTGSSIESQRNALCIPLHHAVEWWLGEVDLGIMKPVDKLPQDAILGLRNAALSYLGTLRCVQRDAFFNAGSPAIFRDSGIEHSFVDFLEKTCSTNDSIWEEEWRILRAHERQLQEAATVVREAAIGVEPAVAVTRILKNATSGFFTSARRLIANDDAGRPLAPDDMSYHDDRGELPRPLRIYRVPPPPQVPPPRGFINYVPPPLPALVRPASAASSAPTEPFTDEELDRLVARLVDNNNERIAAIVEDNSDDEDEAEDEDEDEDEEDGE